MKEVLIIFGGVSQEHDISIITGVLTLNSIDKTCFNPVPIYISKSGQWYTGKELFNISFYKNIDYKKLSKVCIIAGEDSLYKITKNKLKKLLKICCVINCMHGKNGEDGAISGLLALSNIPLCSPNMFCSSLSMDKFLTKNFVKNLGVNTVEGSTIEKDIFCKNTESAMLEVVDKISFPIIVKPCSSGSSIGIGVASNFSQFEDCLRKAFEFDNIVLCERYIENGVDINCAVYKLQKQLIISKCEKPISANDILTFNDKYNGSKTGVIKEFPAKIDNNVAEKIREISGEIYESLGFNGIVRFDFLLKDNEIYFNEINSVPGSLAYYLFSEKLSDFMDLLTSIIQNTLVNFNKNQQIKKTIDCSFLMEDIDTIKK